MLTERLTEHLRLTKSARQSLSAVAGQEREWNRMLGQRGCELVDGMARGSHQGARRRTVQGLDDRIIRRGNDGGELCRFDLCSTPLGQVHKQINAPTSWPVASRSGVG